MNINERSQVDRWAGVKLSIVGITIAFSGFGLLFLELNALGKFLVYTGLILNFVGLGWHFVILRKSQQGRNTDSKEFNRKPWE